MKRHTALRDLSSDHHQGLVHARRLIKAEDGGGEAQGEVAEAAGDFLTFWAEHTTRHFREEEEVLLPAFARYGDPAVDTVVQMLVEHVHIRRLVSDLEQQVGKGRPSAQTMGAIGEMLRSHIRHEEDVVFPLIERAMPEEALTELQSQLAAFSNLTM